MKKNTLIKDLEELKSLGLISEKGYNKNMDEIENRLNESINESKKIIKKNKKRLKNNSKDFMFLFNDYLASNLPLISARPL